MKNATVCALVIAVSTAISGTAFAATMSSHMSKKDTMMMKKCQSMSKHEMMRNRRCMAMMKRTHMNKNVSPASHNAGIKQEK